MPAAETARPPSIAEQALVLAFRAFGAGPDDPAWGRLAPHWREALEATRRLVGDRPDAAMARDRLAREHEAEARPDPGRIHPSWWARALKHEPESVRRAVAASAPDPVGPALRRAFAGLDDGPAPAPTRPPLPEALATALTLAAERLVGGPARRDDDPPVVRAIAALDPRGRSALAAALGLAKLAFAGEDRSDRPRIRARLEVLRPSLPTSRLELVDLALDDLDAARKLGDGRSLAPRLGLGSIGRLLAVVEPHRARWALQHLPYESARVAGGRMSLDAPGLAAADVLSWESALLRAAVVLLAREGRIDPLALADPSPGPGGGR